MNNCMMNNKKKCINEIERQSRREREKREEKEDKEEVVARLASGGS